MHDKPEKCIAVEIGFFCPTKCTGKEEKKLIRKKTVFDNIL